MIRRCAAAVVTVACLTAPAPLLAQNKTMSVTVGAMAVGPLSGSARQFTPGLGVNVGAGLATNRFFAETRYHYVWGPTFSMAAGPVPATGKFLPLVVGVRF